MGKVAWPRPRVVVSRCLGFESCRYDGTVAECALVNELKPFVDFLPVCPEVGAGLGIPRKQIRLIISQEGHRLVEPETRMDRTDSVSRFSARFIGGLGHVDGFILKSRSPSCAIKDAKLYRSIGDVTEAGRGAGLFAKMAMTAFPGAAVGDEASLCDPCVREDFLTKLFTVSRLRTANTTGRGNADLRAYAVSVTGKPRGLSQRRSQRASPKGHCSPLDTRTKGRRPRPTKHLGPVNTSLCNLP